MTNHVFITGASGFIGRNMVRHHVAQGKRVTGLSRNASGAARIAALGATPVIGDMMTTDLAPLMAGADQLVHAAADLDHGPGRQALSNATGTDRVLAAAREAGVASSILISSDSALQDGRALCNVDEATPYPQTPAGAYSAGKAESEKFALRRAAEGLHVMILRPRMVWGRDDGTALPMLAKVVEEGRFAWISGGGYLSSTTHVANLSHAVDLAFSRGRSGEIYHVSDGPARPFRETVTRLLATRDLWPPDKSVPRGVLRTIARVSGAIYRVTGGRVRGPLSFQEYATSAVEISLDIGKARRELDYNPVISFDEGLEELSSNAWRQN
jgi:nucleoside-diphosphate-sugar epimerase